MTRRIPKRVPIVGIIVFIGLAFIGLFGFVPGIFYESVRDDSWSSNKVYLAASSRVYLNTTKSVDKDTLLGGNVTLFDYSLEQGQTRATP